MEGIKVHGHWIIDVRNPDGKLVKHLEFENALMPGGGNALARFLGRAQTVGAWEIELSNFPASGSPFGTGSGLSGSGWIVESTSSRSESISPYGTVSKTLSITSPAFSINTAGSLVLGGNVAAVLTGSFSSVATWNRFCSQTTSPADCVGNTNIALFTATPIAPVNLSAGQIVQVTVTISFSSTP